VVDGCAIDADAGMIVKRRANREESRQGESGIRFPVRSTYWWEGAESSRLLPPILSSFEQRSRAVTQVRILRE